MTADSGIFRIEALLELQRLINGDRDLEVLHIPGHTPDAIALLDADAGYLWTEDSFYEGTIWLFAPETDLVAYEASVARMAALVLELTLLMPAHNAPAADPIRLNELRDALAGVIDGTLVGTMQSENSRWFATRLGCSRSSYGRMFENKNEPGRTP